MKNLVLFFVLIGIVACKEHKSEGGLKIKGTSVSENVRKIPIPVEEPDRITKLSELIDSSSISLFPLETTAESVLATVHHFKVYDGCIYIKSDQDRTVKAFSKNGKYLGAVDAAGRGPEEYGNLMDFDVNRDTLVILDFERLVMYNRHSFEFIRVVNLREKGISANYFKYDHGRYYFKCNNIGVIKASTVVCDSALNVVAVLNEPSHHTKLSFSSSPYFIPIGDEMYYYQVMNDTIYKITDEALEATWILDGGKHSLGYERYNRLPNYSEAFPMPVVPRDYIKFIDGFYCSDSLLAFGVVYNDQQFTGLYSLRTDRLKFWDVEKVEDDIFNSQHLWASCPTDGEYFYTMIYPGLFLKNGNVPKKAILTKMNADDNPVLVKFKFRQF